MGSEFNECSIAASELSARVDLLLSRQASLSLSPLYLESPEGFERVTLATVDVSELTENPHGRFTQLKLARNSEDPDSDDLLLAVTRNDVAFPLARFARRKGDTCDYMHIGQELNDESFIVTPNDDVSRREVIEAMRQVLEVDPMAAEYRHLHGSFLAGGDTSQDLRSLIQGIKSYYSDNYYVGSSLEKKVASF